MKRIPRDPIAFDLINAFAEFGRVENISIHSPNATDGFVERERASISRSLSNAALLHGIRTERMFEAMVASFGGVEILKQEDAGEIYAPDEVLSVPDFRLVMADGSQMLVEVKNFYQGADTTEPFELERDYLDGLIRYSRAMKCDLMFAIYWTKWNIWTLVRDAVFQSRDDKRILNMPEAMKANHMARLGDYSLGTRFPLSLVMCADRSKPRSIDDNGEGTFTISSVEINCAGRLVTDPVEKRIATYLMFFGKWEYQTKPRVVGDQLEAIEHFWVPRVDNKQGFEIVGSLSELFCSFYKNATQNEGLVGALRLDVTPGAWGNLIPRNYSGKALPLWRFVLQPSPPDVTGEVAKE